MRHAAIERRDQLAQVLDHTGGRLPRRGHRRRRNDVSRDWFQISPQPWHRQ
jgi:hypothetical protein